MNCSDGVCDGEPVFISICGSMILVNFRSLTLMVEMESVTEPVLIPMLWYSAFSKAAGH